MKNLQSRRNLIVVTLVVVLAAIVGGIYIYMNNNVVKSDFESENAPILKNYSNEQYGYEISYPDTFALSSGTNKKTLISNTPECLTNVEKTSNSDGPAVPQGCFYITISVQRSPVTYRNFDVTHVLIGGVSGERIIFDNGVLYDQDQQVNKGNLWFIIKGESNISEKQLLKNSLGKIFSTFKFPN